MANDHAVGAPPGKKGILVPFARKIRTGAIGEMRLARPLHRMIAGVDAGHGGNRAKLADGRVGDIAVVDDIRIVAELHLQKLRARADLRVGAKPTVTDISRRINEGCGRETFWHRHGQRVGRGSIAEQDLMTGRCRSDDIR
jgi:hypothetical protein